MPWLFKRSLDAAPYLKKGEFGHFSVKWAGDIYIPPSDGITLRAKCPADLRVKISGRKAIDTHADPPQDTASLAGAEAGWHPIQAKLSSGSDGCRCVLEWRHGASGDFVPVPRENFRHLNGKDSRPGLWAKYYLTPDFHDKWRERVDDTIDFDWTDLSPFDEWLRRGYPPAGVCNPHPYPKKGFEDWTFHLNAWPAIFLTGKPGPTMTAAWVCLGINLLLLAVSLSSLVHLTVRGRRSCRLTNS
jgi:hypothetical protein